MYVCAINNIIDYRLQKWHGISTAVTEGFLKDVRKSELHFFQTLSFQSRSHSVGVAIPWYFRDGMQTLVSSVSQTFCSNGIKRLLVFEGITHYLQGPHKIRMK